MPTTTTVSAKGAALEAAIREAGWDCTTPQGLERIRRLDITLGELMVACENLGLEPETFFP
jgi:hypothetical protein